MARATQVRVSVRLPDATPPPPGARVRVSVEEVGRADAPAPQVAADAFPASAAVEGVLGPFVLPAELPAGGEYAVRVHVDRSGDGRVVAGDLVSVARHPVRAGTDEVEVAVRAVPEDPAAGTDVAH